MVAFGVCINLGTVITAGGDGGEAICVYGSEGLMVRVCGGLAAQ